MPVGPTVWWVFLFSFWLHLSPQIDAQLVMDLALGTCNIINLEKRQKVLPLNRELLRWEKKVGRSNLLNWLVAICCYVVQTSWYSGIGTIGKYSMDLKRVIKLHNKSREASLRASRDELWNSRLFLSNPSSSYIIFFTYYIS